MGLITVVEDETGATEMRGSFVDGQAWFHDAGGLIAAYAGTANLLILADPTLKAYGYLGAVGTGEALGGDLFDVGAGIFTAGTYSWTAFGGNTIANDANSLLTTYVNNESGSKLFLNDAADLSSDLTIGKLYKLTLDAKVGATDTVAIYVNDGVTPLLVANVTETDFTPFTKYFTAASVDGCYIITYGMGAGEEIWLDNLVLKEVTEPNSNAVHIYKDFSLSDEGYYQIDGGFKYNAGASMDFIVLSGVEPPGIGARVQHKGMGVSI